MILVILSTKYDVKTLNENAARNPYLLSFSLYSNAKKIFRENNNRPTNEIKCLHGIRVLSTFSIILLHTYFYRIKTFEEDPVYIEWMKTKWAFTVAAISISVDSFLVISAAMTTRTMLNELDL